MILSIITGGSMVWSGSLGRQRHPEVRRDFVVPLSR